MSAKNYRDKKALPLVEKLKEVVKNLTIKCVQLMEQSRKLTAKVDGQQKHISRLTDKVMEQNDTIDRLQEKASDLGRLERHLGREQAQLIIERSKALERAERANKRPKRIFELSR
jgi:chromosome segregation ATPase